jgi:hypothetical protein
MSIAYRFAVNSVTESDFRLRNTGIKADLQMRENKFSEKCEIRVKAISTEKLDSLLR